MKEEFLLNHKFSTLAYGPICLNVVIFMCACVCVFLIGQMSATKVYRKCLVKFCWHLISLGHLPLLSLIWRIVSFSLVCTTPLLLCFRFINNANVRLSVTFSNNIPVPLEWNVDEQAVKTRREDWLTISCQKRYRLTNINVPRYWKRN